MGQEIERRHGVDPEALWSEVEAKAREERAAAAVLADVDRDAADRWFLDPAVADRRAVDERAQAAQAPRTTEAWESVGATPGPHAWDSPERRGALAARLDAAGVGVEAKEARMLADQSAGSPPRAAVASLDAGRRQQRPRTPARGRGRGVER